MFFTIPPRFSDPYIFTGLLYEALEEKWDRKSIREKLKDFEFLDNYEKFRFSIGNQPPERIANHFNLCFIVQESGVTSTFGSGNKICLKKFSNTFKIFTDVQRFYYVPEGIISNGKIFSDIKDIFEMKNLSIYKTLQEDFKNCKFVKIESKINVSINVYEKLKNDSTKNYEFKTLRLGCFSDENVINLHFQRATKSFLYIFDVKKYFENYFQCKNRDSGCMIYYSKKSLIENHEEKCMKVSEIHQKPEIIQKEIRNFDILIDKAIRLKMIEKYPSRKDFIFFDIESVLPASEYQTNKMRVLSNHKLVSIAANAFINGNHRSEVWVVSDDSYEAETEIVEKFLDFCHDAQSRIQFDDSLEKIFDFLENHRNNIQDHLFELDEISELRQIFYPFKDLSVFGYNNARYDNSVIFEHIIKVLDHRKIKPSEIRLLKKGPHYFSLKFLDLHFKDLINFSIPTSLDNYLKTWASEFKKLIYPYEKFSTIRQIRDCIDFPPKKDFYSSIKGEVDEKLYQKCKKIYDHHRCLPKNHPKHWCNFEDYLKYYNLSDVEPASVALLRQFETYESHFGLSPMQYLGLPSFSKAAMLKMYDKRCPSMFTFPPNSEATEIFRDQLIGGLCNCYIRHITTDPNEKCAEAAKYNKHGDKWSEIRFYDINAQYPSTFKQKFPCGLGFEWTNIGGILTKVLMTNKKISLGSIEWLDYMNSTDSRLIRPDGKRVQIIFGWGASEVRIGPYKVDGFSKNGEKTFIYEFDGCYFHGCKKCSIVGSKNNDKERELFLRNIENVEIIRMKECEWQKMKKTIEWKSKISKIIKCQKLSEQKFLTHLRNGDLYGFALVKIISTKRADKFLELNWPPLFFKANIEFSDIPIWMQNNAKEADFPRTTVVQGMSNERILLHTELIKFYIENGFEIVNVFKFFEYQGAKCLKIVHDRVYKARVEATREKDEKIKKMKSTAVKLVSNSCYGQMLMVSFIF